MFVSMALSVLSLQTLALRCNESTSPLINYTISIYVNGQKHDVEKSNCVISVPFETNSVWIRETHTAKLSRRLFNILHPVKYLIVVDSPSVTELGKDFLLDQDVSNLMITITSIKTIKSHTFTSDTLTSVKLVENPTEELENEAFFNMSRLRDVDLSDNNLSVFNAEAFSMVPLLENLRLSNNKITHLGKRSFSFVQKDHFCVVLGMNRIVSIDEDVFEGLNRSNFIIDLSFNLLTSFSVNIFRMHHFQEVDLRNNKLKSLSGDFTAHNFKIELLQIRNNFDSKNLKKFAVWALLNKIEVDFLNFSKSGQSGCFQQNFLMVFMLFMFRCLELLLHTNI
ncbi:hypothetical protein Zmor_018951 [Zophobas morio]|uniref:Uncharacterized protein n=1 Tax=Zophobas morio TaxID=2755281 RepID=A0AA38ME43_9CUCU|nr:hypothetical protein Zmor_018951 [Zophobas morio]